MEIELVMRIESLALRCGAALGLAAMLALAGACPAWAAWPADKVIRIIVTNQPGGPTDEVARLLAIEMGPLLGGTLIVENRPGASSNIGITAAARADPDGYTLLLAPTSITVNPAISEKVNFDPIKDFAPISLAVTSPVVFALTPKLGVGTLAGLVELARKQPDLINYSSPGVATVPHLAAELFKKSAGIQMTHVPHVGTAPAAQSVLTGAVHLNAGSMQPAQQLIEAGQMIGLAVSGAKRWRGLPNVPTMTELGYSDFVVEAMFSLFAPARTPPDIVDKLAQTAETVLKRPDAIRRLNATGLEVIAGGPDVLRARVAHEVPFWRELALKAGIKPLR
jgi:tripartite-type tricarboxylate transporter receptor subunit TctC